MKLNGLRESARTPVLQSALDISSAKSWYRTPSLIKLYLLMTPALITSTAWGFDIIMTNSVQSIAIWEKTYGNPTGSTLGFFGASTSIGATIGVFSAPFLAERFGRKPTIFFGSVFVLIGVLVEAWAPSILAFSGGKFILGFGSVHTQIAGPVLVTELAHPKQRVALTSIYNTNIYVGMILGAWISFGTQNIASNWSWRIPILLQLVPTGFQTLFIWMTPESPRWLLSKGRNEQALKFLIKYHGNGAESDLVLSEYTEMKETIEMEIAAAKETKWFHVINTPGNRKRLFITVAVGCFSQTLGSNVISTYLPEVLDSIGLSSQKQKTEINGVITIYTWVLGLFFAIITPYFKRRHMFLTGTTGMLLTFIGWTVASSSYSTSGNLAAGKAVLGFIFLFNLFNAVCWLQLVVTYPLECVAYNLRSKFFAINLLSIELSSFFTTYVTPIGLANVGWKFYIYFTCWIFCALLIIYFFFVETMGPSLEEVARLFDGDDALVGGPGKLEKSDEAES